MIRTILFDLFNTLTNGLIDPEKEIIAEFALDIPYSRVEAVVYGEKFTGWDAYLHSISNALHLPPSETTYRKLRRIFDDDASREFILEGVPDLIETLLSRGYKTGIISNIANPAYDILARDGMKELFGAIIYSYDYGVCKPATLLFNEALSALESRPDDAVMAGDSLCADIQGAELAGITPLLVGSAAGAAGYSRIASILELEEYLRAGFPGEDF